MYFIDYRVVVHSVLEFEILSACIGIDWPCSNFAENSHVIDFFATILFRYRNNGQKSKAPRLQT